MAVSWFVFFLVASVWCSSGILGYSIHRIDHEDGRPVNVEIDFYSNYDTKKVFEDLRKSRMDTTNTVQNYQHVHESESPGADEAKRRMFLLFINNSNSFTGAKNDSTPLDSWSVVWYIASFGGLIIFFLIVSCSEWCCRRAIRNSNQNCATTTSTPTAPVVPDTPPPSYDQFAPPSYESICLGRRGCEKSEYDIYVVPVHALGTIMESRETEDAPPSYLSASTGPHFARFESNQQSRVT